MNTVILSTHIVLLVISLITTTGLVTMSLLKRAPSHLIRRSNLIVTSVGVMLGIGLLLQNPIGTHCVELTAYVAVFSLLYRFVEKRSAITVIPPRANSDIR